MTPAPLAAPMSMMSIIAPTAWISITMRRRPACSSRSRPASRKGMPMKHIVLACGLLLGISATAQAGLLDPAAVDASRFLPPPPVDGSADNKAEFAELKAIAARSTPADVAAATHDAKDEKFDLFNGAVGFDLTALPQTSKLLTIVGEEEEADTKAAKKYFHRIRPYS